MSKPKLSIVIPIYNEELVLDASLTELSSYLTKHDMLEETEVICVVTGDDSSQEIAESFTTEFPCYQVLSLGDRLGKGRTVAEGMQSATGSYRIFMDADLATPLHHLVPLLEELEDGNDIAIGVRDLAAVHEPLGRRLSSIASNWVVRLLVTPGITDTQCGFKGFREHAAKRIFSQQHIRGWGFDFEVLAMSRHFGYKLAILPINDWSDPKGDAGLVGDSQTVAMLATLRELLAVKVHTIRGRYT